LRSAASRARLAAGRPAYRRLPWWALPGGLGGSLSLSGADRLAACLARGLPWAARLLSL